MKHCTQSYLAYFLLLYLSGCTTMQEVRPDAAQLTDYLEVGDHVVVYEKSGRIIDMRFVLIDGDVLRGSLFFDGLEKVEVELDEIEKIEVERIAAGRTTAAVLGGVVLAPLAAVGAGIALADTLVE